MVTSQYVSVLSVPALARPPLLPDLEVLNLLRQVARQVEADGALAARIVEVGLGLHVEAPTGVGTGGA